MEAKRGQSGGQVGGNPPFFFFFLCFFELKVLRECALRGKRLDFFAFWTFFSKIYLNLNMFSEPPGLQEFIAPQGMQKQIVAPRVQLKFMK